MTNKKLTKKQLDVIEDLFTSQLDEQAVLDKHNVARHIFNKWLKEELFDKEFCRRIAWLNRLSEALIARYASLAAAKLVQLTESEKEETARKACLDIINLPKSSAKPKPAQIETKAQTTEPQPLSKSAASKLLAFLAEEKRNA